MFKISTTDVISETLKTKKKKKKRKKQLSLFSKFEPKDVSFSMKESELHNKESTIHKENLKNEAITLWKYNSITDDFEFKEDDDELIFNLFDKKNIENYLNFKKQGTHNIALQRLSYYRKSYEENEKQIERNKIFLNKLSSRQLFTDNFNNEDEDENEDSGSEEHLACCKEKEISEFDELKRNSLPMIINKEKIEENNNRVIRAVNQSLHSNNNPEQNHGSNYFLSLAETIEGICKMEHINHRKFLKNFKNENRLVKTNMLKIIKKFEKI